MTENRIALASALLALLLSPCTVLADETVTDWSGVYVGANVGYGWGQFVQGQWLDQTKDGYLDGVTGGATVGYNLQLTDVVLGIEADLQASGIDGSFGTHPMANNTWNCEEQARCYNSVEWYATVRGRAGFAYKSYLPFITAGLAYAGVTSRDTHEGGKIGTDLYKNVFGVAAGAGIEKAFSEHLTAKVDTLYIGLLTMQSKSDKDYFSHNNFGVVRAGLNWRF